MVAKKKPERRVSPAEVKVRPLSQQVPKKEPLRSVQKNVTPHLSAARSETKGIRAVGAPHTATLPPQRQRSIVGSFPWRFIVLTLVGAIVVGVCAWLLFAEEATPAQKKEAYIESVVQEIAGKALIPQGETPTIGVIPDPTTIPENKDFFRNASQGDYLVVFPHARLMLVYSPTKKVIVNMGYAPLSESDGEQRSSSVKK